MSSSRSDDAEKALRLASTLETILDREFDVLKSSNLDEFESLQPEKLTILQDLTHTHAVSCFDINDSRHSYKSMADLVEVMESCKNKFQRNDLLINKKIETVKSALNTLRNGSDNRPLELYDKLGMLGSKKRGG